MTMKETVDQVKIGGELTEEFQISQGLKQGDALAPMPFNLALEYIVRKTQVDVNATIINRSVQLVGYADNLNILGRSLPAMKETFLELEEAAREIVLKINEEKTKMVMQSRRRGSRIGPNLTIGNYNFKVVRELPYLGSMVTSNNDE